MLRNTVAVESKCTQARVCRLAAGASTQTSAPVLEEVPHACGGVEEEIFGQRVSGRFGLDILQSITEMDEIAGLKGPDLRTEGTEVVLGVARIRIIRTIIMLQFVKRGT